MENHKLCTGQTIGRLHLIIKLPHDRWRCVCNCGNITTPYGSNLKSGRTSSCGSCGKNYYQECPDGETVKVTSTNGINFYVDKSDVPIALKYKWHVTTDQKGTRSVISSNGIYLHQLLMGNPKNMEVDHIDFNRLNNRRCNLRIVTHQQNQMNQPLQKNNTSGISGVSYYAPRKKYRARIKACQHDIHLGYYETFLEAVQARNVGMACMFGEYGCYNDVPEAPEWIKTKVKEQCKRFTELSVCEAFLASKKVV